MNKESKFICPGRWYTENDANGIPVKAVYDESYREALGYESEEEYEDARKNWTNRIHPEDAQRVEEHYIDVISKHPEGMDYDIEYRIMTRWGFRWIHDYGHCTRREDGSLERCDGVIFDIQDAVESKRVRNGLIQQMMDGESVYIVNPENDAFSVIFRNRYLSETYGQDAIYSESISKYIRSDVYPADRERMSAALELSNLVAQVNSADEYVQEYQDISSGRPVWYRMRARKLSGTEILLGFADKDREIANRLVYESIREDYVAMFGVNLDEARVKVLKKSDSRPDYNVDSYIPYRDFIKELSDSIKGKAGKQIARMADVAYMRQILAEENKYIVRYQAPVNGVLQWSACTIYVIKRHEDGSPFLFSMGFYRLDTESSRKEELQQEVNRAMDMIGGLANGYSALYRVNLDTGEYENYHLTEQTDNIRPYYEKCPRFADLAHSFADSPLVHQEDRDNLHAFYKSEEDVQKKLKGRKTMAMLFRRNYGGVFLWTELTIVKCEPKNDTAHTVIVGFIEKDQEVREKEMLVRETEEAELLIKNFASKFNLAYGISMADDSFNVLRIDENVIGLDKTYQTFSDIIKFFLSEVVHPVDRDRMADELDYSVIRKKLKKEKSYTVEYRSLVNNASNWNQMIVTHVKGENIAIGFSFNNLEVTKRRLEDIRVNEYLGFFSIDLDTEMIQPLKETMLFKTCGVGEAVPYETAMGTFAGCLSGEARALITTLSRIDYLKQEFAVENKRSYSFKSTLTKDPRWVNIAMYAILRHDDGSPAVIAMGFNLADSRTIERQELRRQLNEALEMAETASKAKTSFLNSMSHDIRTPMNAITGFTSMAKRFSDDKDKVMDYLDKIDIAGQELLMLINQVLEMSRIESGKIVLDEVPLNVRESYNRLTVVLAEQAKMAGLEFECSIGNISHPSIFADDARMSQITMNITGNAIKYTPRGGHIKYQLRENPCSRDGYASFTFTVEDNGIGMSAEYQKVLFEPFSREKSSTVSKIQGTGLGMPIVKSLVDLLEGTIEVHSELGKGTRFDVTVEFKINEEEANIVDENKSATSAAEFKDKRILLVEDNEMNREIAKFILEEQGVIIEEAEDGSIAVDVIQRNIDSGQGVKYDAILMDVQMPIMNGYEATKTIREILTPAGLHIPIIALSANAFEEDRQKSIDAGMDDHIAKPIDIDQLRTVLSKHLITGSR